MKKSKKARKPKKRAVRKLISLKTTFKRSPTLKTPKAAEGRPLSEAAVQQFRELLTQKRDDLLLVVQRKKEQEFQIEEPEIGDEADIATRSVEKEMLFELTDSEKQTLDSIEAALRKIEKGAFGRCESCQKPITRLRLDVMPWARYCIECQARNEVPTE